MKTLVVTGGGTAGHVMPILALLPHLSPCKIHYIGSSGMEKSLVKTADVIYHEITSTKLIRSLSPKNLLIPFKLTKAIIEARSILKEIKPDLIFSKGGYVSLPVALASGKTPTILHESDMTLGLANKIALRSCDKLLTSFNTITHEKATCVGSPLRREIYLGNPFNALKKCKINENGKPFLLIFGGSLGSKKINQTVTESLDFLLKDFNVVHIVGKGNLSTVVKPNYYQAEFESDVQDFFALADYVVSRGGANSLFELIALKKPTLCIPLGKGQSRGDQIDNAEYFKKLGCIEVLSENDLTPQSLISAIEKTKNNGETLRKNARAAQNIDGTAKIAKIINSYL